MKKLILGLLLLPFIFSCNINNWDDSVISNNSDFEVTFKFNNTGQINIPIGGQATFKTETYQHLVSYAPDKRVYFTYSATNDGYTGEFHTRQSWTVDVNNGIGEEATLSADGWMEDIPVTISGGTGKVFIDKPNFVVRTESNFPAVAVYNRDTNGTFKVTIQWSK